MCGIAGYFLRDRRPATQAQSHALATGIASLAHRGPDGEAIYEIEGLGLAHARLAVIDLSAAANQPMVSADSQVALIFNGEIYNFAELRAELEAKGLPFKTSHSDTETILNGYRAWGLDVVLRLRGMFAIALYDRAKDQLMLVRDRLGKKPLYYVRTPDALVFGSEIKALLPWPGVPRAPDLSAIHHYLTFQYVPGPKTAFQGIAKLGPGEMLMQTRGQEPSVQRYWQPPRPNLSPTPTKSSADLEHELIERLREATRIRLISDVPLGAFLSGGVDSSAVVAMMAQASSRPVKTFTIGFDETAFDERQYAQAVADKLGTEHTLLVLKPDASALIPRLIYHYGEPFADASALATMAVAEITREHVTVALNGDGGDELFVGYERYRWFARLEAIASRLPRPLLWLAARSLAALPDALARVRLIGRLKRLAQVLDNGPLDRYAPFMSMFSDADKSALYGPTLAPYLSTSSTALLAPFFAGAHPGAAAAVSADLETYLPGDLLVKVDVASMAYGLECRSPFLDHELLEFAAQIPFAQKLPGGELKGLLKHALEPYLPHDILYRPKQGFGVPIADWLRAELKPMLQDVLLSPTAKARGLFKPAAVERLIAEHQAGRNHAPRLWTLLMLELWFLMWIDQTLPMPMHVRLNRFPAHAASIR